MVQVIKKGNKMKYNVYGSANAGYELLAVKKTEQEAIKYVFGTMNNGAYFSKFMVIRKSKELGDKPVGLYFTSDYIKPKTLIKRR